MNHPHGNQIPGYGAQGYNPNLAANNPGANVYKPYGATNYTQGAMPPQMTAGYPQNAQLQNMYGYNPYGGAAMNAASPYQSQLRPQTPYGANPYGAAGLSSSAGLPGTSIASLTPSSTGMAMQNQQISPNVGAQNLAMASNARGYNQLGFSGGAQNTPNQMAGQQNLLGQPQSAAAANWSLQQNSASQNLAQIGQMQQRPMTPGIGQQNMGIGGLQGGLQGGW